MKPKEDSNITTCKMYLPDDVDIFADYKKPKSENRKYSIIQGNKVYDPRIYHDEKE